MKFGEIKTLIENSLIESYKNQSNFKKTLKEFQEDVLKNKNILRIYSIYDELSSPKGLNSSDAYNFVTEGIEQIKKHIKNVILPSTNEWKRNDYELIDKLVYESNSLELSEIVSIKKKLAENISSKIVEKKETLNIPISSMLKVANQNVENFIFTLDESTKNELLEIISEDKEFLSIKYNTLREEAILKLKDMLLKESDSAVKNTIKETIDKVEKDEFNQLNYYKLKKLIETI